MKLLTDRLTHVPTRKLIHLVKTKLNNDVMAETYTVATGLFDAVTYKLLEQMNDENIDE